MILEGLVTTTNLDGTVNVSPMGPVMDGEICDGFRLRPFDTSTTYGNLSRTSTGVLHVTDNVEMIAQAAVGRLPQPALRPCAEHEGWILLDACRWYVFRVGHVHAAGPRIDMECEVVDSGNQREFWGFNRAKHAVLELAILATRVHLLEPQVIWDDVKRWESLVAKTAGPAEFRAFDFLVDYLRQAVG